MAKRLLARQIELLGYLTSGTTIFGEDSSAPVDRSLRGIDRNLLHLEARFSHEKRMEKISAVFPNTFELLDSTRATILRQFAETCPPISIGRLENASQFYDFLCTSQACEPEDPPYLVDVAACELACARVRADAEEREPEPERASKRNRTGRKGTLRRRIRRRPGIVLLRCAYDIRPIFEEDSTEAVPPAERDTPLVIAMPPGSVCPQVFEVLPAVFDLLGALNDWTDPAAFGRTAEIKQLIHDLTEHGLLEVRE